MRHPLHRLLLGLLLYSPRALPYAVSLPSGRLGRRVGASEIQPCLSRSFLTHGVGVCVGGGFQASWYWAQCMQRPSGRRGRNLGSDVLHMEEEAGFRHLLTKVFAQSVC